MTKQTRMNDKTLVDFNKQITDIVGRGELPFKPCPACCDGSGNRISYTKTRECGVCGGYGEIAPGVLVNDAVLRAEAVDDRPPHVIFLVDNSSSMGHLASVVPEAVNAFLADQRRYSGPCDFSLYLFGDKLRCVYDSVPLLEVPPFSKYSPHEGTRLRASIAYLLGQQMNRPALVCAFSDGGDGWSVPNYVDLRKQADGLGWVFTYVGIGQSAEKASRIGIDDRNSVKVAATGKGLRDAVMALSRAAVIFRDGGTDFESAMKAAHDEVAKQGEREANPDVRY